MGLRLSAPFIPFLTEELYQHLPGNNEKSIMLEPFPVNLKVSDYDSLLHLFNIFNGCISYYSEMYVVYKKDCNHQFKKKKKIFSRNISFDILCVQNKWF